MKLGMWAYQIMTNFLRAFQGQTGSPKGQISKVSWIYIKIGMWVYQANYPLPVFQSHYLLENRY